MPQLRLLFLRLLQNSDPSAAWILAWAGIIVFIITIIGNRHGRRKL